MPISFFLSSLGIGDRQKFARISSLVDVKSYITYRIEGVAAIERRDVNVKTDARLDIAWIPHQVQAKTV